MAKTTHRSKNDSALRKASAELFRTPDDTYKALFRDFLQEEVRRLRNP
jgi:hypothetical protein